MKSKNVSVAAMAAAVLFGCLGAALAAGTPSDADGQQRWLNVVNRSNVPIYRFHMTDVDTRGWGNDLLGRRVVDPGRAARVFPHPVQSDRGYCRFDILVVFEDHSRFEQRQVNICRASTLVCSRPGSCRLQ